MSITLSRNQKIKTKIKAVLEGMPFGMGLKIAMPMAKWLLAVFYYHTWTRQFQGRLNAKTESRNIQFKLKNGIDKAIIIYDNIVSPPTIGDLLNVIMLVRYLEKKDVSVTFYFISDEYRSDWPDWDCNEKNTFLELQNNLVRKFAKKTKILTIGWAQFCNQIKNKDLLNYIVPFYNRIINRVSIYGDCFNVINYLLENEEKEFIDSFLLCSSDFNSISTSLPKLPNKYVTWHVRKNELWGFERNLSEEQFLSYYRRIKSQNPLSEVLIISDQIGVDYYIDMARKNSLSILSCKDFGHSFFDDCYIILNSHSYYQLEGGGIGMVPIYSLLPYELVGGSNSMAEIAWRYPKFTSWATKAQNRYYCFEEVL